ncbi:dimethylarginine dimethylaminohydrolase family protein [Leuconostoc mesenteroides]|uniref:dimethylarginine dimethylaminohydrolase family protein n=1 Tax=Leuconostoc mesenteroides TaxID=1245 RepID=UPI000E070911|nr:arginine deiminase family protein [Leuconostoc mesenteroides]TPF01906.1 arginine deiminase [Leuconostoc mesenteroides]STY38958.1 arginine deiminase [Leuconostoc mesenteroides]
MKINVYNEYDPLKEVIIGDATKLYFPDTHEIEQEEHTSKWKQFMTKHIYTLLRGKKVPSFLAKKFQRELAEFQRILETHGVKVHHVDSVTPTKLDPYGMGQMYARDSAMSVGEHFIEGNVQIEMRKIERRGYQRIVAAINDKNQVHTLNQKDKIYLEGGDVIVNYPYVFVGIGKYASNEAGAKWLQSILDKDFENEIVDRPWKVVPVYLNDDAILHLDCCMTIIGPKTRKEMGGNVLVIGPKKVIVQKRHTALQEALKNEGYTVIPIVFTWHSLLDGALRCASCPLVREKNE